VPVELTYDQHNGVSLPPKKAFTWPRLLSPSLSDLFFLFITAWMFLVNPVGWQRLLLDADTTLHIRIGQYILSTGTVPHQDLFAFSKPGQPWYAFEWLSETVLGGAFNVAGFKGVALLSGVLIALYLTVLLKYTIWKGSNGLIALILILLTATGASIHFHARPHLVTLLFVAIAVWFMESNRRNGGHLIWALVPLTAVWANLHGGFFIFVALLGLRVAGCAAEAWVWPEIRQDRKREAIQLMGLLVACSLASLANPYGFRLHQHILETLTSPWIIANVSEFKSPSFRSEEMYDIMFLLFGGLASITSLVRKRSLVEPLWILFLAYCALTSVRHTTLFLLVAAPIVAVELSGWWDSVAARQAKKSVLRMVDDMSRQLSAKLPGTSLFIPLTIIGLAVAPGLQWPTAFSEQLVPVKLIESHIDLLANSRVFTSDQIADYLIFRNYPRQRVFIDSRHNYYGDKIGDDYIAISEAGPKWSSLLDKYRFNLILCEVDAPIGSLVRAAGGWHVIDRSAKYILFERDIKA
jgi:hypothetical protein